MGRIRTLLGIDWTGIIAFSGSVECLCMSPSARDDAASGEKSQG